MKAPDVAAQISSDPTCAPSMPLSLGACKEVFLGGHKLAPWQGVPLSGLGFTIPQVREIA